MKKTPHEDRAPEAIGSQHFGLGVLGFGSPAMRVKHSLSNSSIGFRV